MLIFYCAGLLFIRNYLGLHQIFFKTFENTSTYIVVLSGLSTEVSVLCMLYPIEDDLTVVVSMIE